MNRQEQRLSKRRSGKGELAVIKFQWLTDIEITEKNAIAIAIAGAGRKRWKMENEGFNTQKNLRYDLEHANSQNWNAIKNHYLITQITDIFRQHYVYRELKKSGIKKTEKNISSDMLASFSQRLTKEDIFIDDVHRVAVN